MCPMGSFITGDSVKRHTTRWSGTFATWCLPHPSDKVTRHSPAPTLRVWRLRGFSQDRETPAECLQLPAPPPFDSRAERAKSSGVPSERRVQASRGARLGTRYFAPVCVLARGKPLVWTAAFHGSRRTIPGAPPCAVSRVRHRAGRTPITPGRLEQTPRPIPRADRTHRTTVRIGTFKTVSTLFTVFGDLVLSAPLK